MDINYEHKNKLRISNLKVAQELGVILKDEFKTQVRTCLDLQLEIFDPFVLYKIRKMVTNHFICEVPFPPMQKAREQGCRLEEVIEFWFCAIKPSHESLPFSLSSHQYLTPLALDIQHVFLLYPCMAFKSKLRANSYLPIFCIMNIFSPIYLEQELVLIILMNKILALVHVKCGILKDANIVVKVWVPCIYINEQAYVGQINYVHNIDLLPPIETRFVNMSLQGFGTSTKARSKYLVHLGNSCKQVPKVTFSWAISI